jgi:hypothetical protein
MRCDYVGTADPINCKAYENGRCCDVVSCAGVSQDYEHDQTNEVFIKSIPKEPDRGE